MESFSQQLRVHSLSPGQRGVEPGSLPLGTSPSCSIILITRTLMNMKTWCPSTPTFPPHVASDINGCLGAGSSCFLGHQIQRLRGKSLERPPSPSVPHHVSVLHGTVSITQLVSIFPGPNTKPSDVSVQRLAYPGCWNFRHIITGFSRERGKHCL